MRLHGRCLALVSLLIAVSCNFPRSASPSEVPLEDQAATLVAGTLQVQSPESQATPTLAVVGTAPPTPTATGTITPTYALPLLKVNEDTNCRAGPGQDYEVVVVIRSGAQVEILGRSTSGNYWIIKNPADGTSCWLWGEYATPSGSVHLLPSMTPPATSTPGLPAAPSNLRYNYSCAYNGVGTDVTTSLQWNDNARNESGYRIYRDGALVVELPADSSAFVETAAIALGANVTYSVEAFNNTGASARATISFTC